MSHASQTHLIYRQGIKIILAVLFCLCALISVFGGIGVYLAGEADMYVRPREEVKEDLFDRVGYATAERALYDVYHAYAIHTVEELLAIEAEITDELLGELASESNVLLSLCDGEGRVIASTYDGRPFVQDGEVELHLFRSAEGGGIDRIMRFYIPEELSSGGTVWRIDRHLPLVYGLRFWLAAVFGLAALGAIASLVVLICAAGHHTGESEARPSFFERLPTDLMLLLYFLATLCIGILYARTFNDPSVLTLLLCVVLLLSFLPLFLLFLLSLATRIKCRMLLKNTLVFLVLRALWRYVLRPACRLLGGIPLVWKSSLAFALYSLLELLLLLLISASGGIFVLWLVKTLLIGLLVVYLSLSMRRLMRGGRALARGELTYQIDEDGLVGDFRAHAQHLNHISEGMTQAVEERLQSERFRTELITNVSHDIKTPLTSIISYIHLLKDTPEGSEQSRQYIDTIDRQSIRLKKLMEDLIDVSKATTGNVEIHSAPCELAVLLSQALGEYEERMRAAELLPVLHISEPAPIVMADGRLLWRVFDNLLSNALKYAMSGTRVYIDLVSEQSTAKLTIRNVSRDELNVKATDLLERFVRGDRSRHTEGSGLGLSIAQSLTERMGGSLELLVDGDLFKVTVQLPLMQNE